MVPRSTPTSRIHTKSVEPDSASGRPEEKPSSITISTRGCKYTARLSRQEARAVEVASGAVMGSLVADSKTVIARLDRAIQYSRGLSARPCNLRIQIVPVRIVLLDQRNLPGPRPLLEPFFALNGLFDLLKHLEVDEARDI